MTEEEFRTRSGRVLTDDDFQVLADEAERGYDVSHLQCSHTDVKPIPGKAPAVVCICGAVIVYPKGGGSEAVHAEKRGAADAGRVLRQRDSDDSE